MAVGGMWGGLTDLKKKKFYSLGIAIDISFIYSLT